MVRTWRGARARESERERERERGEVMDRNVSAAVVAVRGAEWESWQTERQQELADNSPLRLASYLAANDAGLLTTRTCGIES